MKINDEYWNSERDVFSNRGVVLFQDEHLPELNDCKSILDLGCGTGILVDKLNSKGIDCHGITYSKLEVEKSKNKNVHYGDMHNIPFDNNLFDGFIMWDSLEQCQSAYIALCEAKRILKDNGKGLIFMPGQNWLNCGCHICCYTPPQMEQLFRQSGFLLESTFEKAYADDKNCDCYGMAVYVVQKIAEYKATFARK